MSTDVAFLIVCGSWFQRKGARWENARPPADFLLIHGIVRSPAPCDRSARGGLYGVMRSDRYEGASPCSDLYARRRSLKSDLACIGSQCREISTGVM